MKKAILWMLWVLFMFICLNSFASAGSDPDSLGVSKQGECIDLYQICDDCTYVTLISVTYPNSTVVNLNTNMTKIGVEFNYSWCGTDALGGYLYKVCGDKDNDFKCEVIEFTITPNGEELTTPKVITYVIILAFLVIFLLISIYMFINSGFQENTYKVKIKKLWWFGISYILMTPILFILWQITEQFLTSITIIGRIFSGLFYIWTLGFIAVFVFSMFFILRTIYIQKEVQRLINKGWPEDEARNRVKRRRR
jgi:hypothetical protein